MQIAVVAATVDAPRIKAPRIIVSPHQRRPAPRAVLARVEPISTEGMGDPAYFHPPALSHHEVARAVTPRSVLRRIVEVGAEPAAC